MDCDWDRQDREQERGVDREVRDFDLGLNRVFAAIFMIGEREFRFVDDGELIDDDLDLLLPLFFVVADDRVGIKLMDGLRVGDVLLE